MADPPILICYDGSETARRAIVVAAPLLGKRRAVVLDVGPLQMVAGDYVALDPDAVALDRTVYEDARAQARAGAELARDAGFRAQARAHVDTPTWKGIVDVADQIDAAAIVVGSRGLTGIRELFSGSLSHEVAVHSGRPVLIVPPPNHASITRFAHANRSLPPDGRRQSEAAGVDGLPALLCYDGSEHARRAIATAADLLEGRTAVAVDIGPVMVAEGYGASPLEEPDLDYVGYESADALANEGAELAQTAGFRAKARADIETSTWRGIVEAADEINAAVIVLGSRGLTGLRGLLEPSVSHSVAKHAGRPVLIVPPRH